MTDKTRLALLVTASAALVALLGNWLLWVEDWGLGLTAWLAAAAACAWAASRWGGARIQGAWAIGLAVAFAGAYAWRATPWLRALDVLVIAVALTLPVWRTASGALRRAMPGEVLGGAWAAGTGAIAGWVHAFDPEIRWGELLKGGALRQGFGVLVGLGLALPLLLVFGGLFMAADPHFSKLVKDTVTFKPEEAILHVFFFGLLLWGVGGFLFTLFWRREDPTVLPHRIVLGLTPVATVLVLLDALFGVFVALQLPYLFGGAARVAAEAGLTWAEYARHGFFELVLVTALALPLLLGLHGIIGARSPRAETVFRVLAGAMVLLLAVIVASATQRMALYQDAYGWTTARLFVLAFEGWLAVVLVWFAATVLRGRADAFVAGTLVWGFLAAALMHVPNWESLIVRHNVAMAGAGRAVDLDYLRELSLDAAPALAEALPSFHAETGRQVARRLKADQERISKADWRSWTWSKAAATQAIAPHRTLVETLAVPEIGPPSLYSRSMDRYGAD